MLFDDRSDDPADDPEDDLDGDGATRASDRLARWLRPTPAEVLGLVVLLVGAVLASALWWWQASQRPDPDHGPAAAVGAAVDPDGEVEAPAPGSDHDAATAGTGADAGGADGSGAPTDPDAADAQGGGDGPNAAGPHDHDGDGGASGDGPLTVHVSGAVLTPGVATLPGGSRVGDAVAAVGGATDEAELERINLARALQDGEHVHVPRDGEEPPIPVDPGDGGGGTGNGSDAGAGDGGDGGGDGQVREDTPIDLNAASAQELEALPGVGPARAEAIVEHREQHGPFAVPGDLRDVSGIGEVTFQRLAPLVSVG